MSYKSLSDEQKKSDFGQALSQQLAQAKERAAQFKDQIADTNAEIKNLSSDSFKSDVFASGISTVSTSMQALISVTQLAGGETKNLEKAVSQLIVIQTTAAASIKVINALQQQSALMLGVRKIQEMALTASINLRTAAESRGVVVTKAATAASAAFNAVSKMNPYVLLATAILAVGTAIYAYVKASEKAESVDTERETQLKKLTEMHNHMAEKVGGSVGDVLGKYKALQKQWGDLRTEHEKMQFLQDNQSAFQSLGLAVKSVSDAETVLVKMAPQVVAALKAVAEASAFEDLYKESITKKAKEWERRSKSTKTGDYYARLGQYDAEAYAPARLMHNKKEAAASRDEWKNAGVTENDITSVSGRFKLTKEGIDKVNRYRNQEAIKLNKQLEKGYEEEISFYEKRWDEARENAENARKEIPQNLFSSGGGKSAPSGTTSSNKSVKVDVKPVVSDDSEKQFEKQLETLSEKNAKITRTQSYSSFDVAVGNDKPNGDKDLSYIQSQMNFNDSLIKQLQDLQSEYAKLGEAGADAYALLGAEIEKVVSENESLGKSAKSISKQNKRIEENAQQWQAVSNSVGQVGNAFSSLGSAFEMPVLDLAGVIAQSIATLIRGAMEATAQAASLGPWAWVAFGAAAMA